MSAPRRGGRGGVPSASRAARAAVLVALLVGAPGLLDAAFGEGSASAASESAGARVEDAGFLADAQRARTQPGAAALETFEAELFSLAPFEDVRATEDGSVVGFTAPGDAQAAFSLVVQRMEESGWIVVPSGSDQAGSFVKGEGRLGWAFATCLAVGDATSVVVRTAGTSD